MTTRDTSHSPHTARSLLAQLTLAGAAALAGSSANAQVTVVSVNETVGFGAGEVTSFTSALPGSSQFGIGTAHNSVHLATGSIIRQNSVNFGRVAGSFTMAVSVGPGHDINTPYGFVFSSRFFFLISGALLVESVQGPGAATTENLGSSYGPNYLSFRFTPSPNGSSPNATGPFDYGWLELGGFTLGHGKASVTIDRYAYDVSGAKIPNGYIPPNATFVPEPSAEVALAAFSALALGAVGVRRLKALHAAAKADKPVEGTP